MTKYRVGIIGATGMVGQRFVTLLSDHPWFEISALAASASSAGKTYREAVAGRWAFSWPIPEKAAGMTVMDASQVEAVAKECDFVFCAVAMDKKATRALEESYAQRYGESLLRISKKTIRSKICRTLPYVGDVAVKISLPDTVTLRVTYTQAKLSVAEPGGYTLLDSRGKVLQTGVAEPPDYAAVLTGVTLASAVPGETVAFEGENMFKYVTELTAAFEENGIDGVTAIDLSDLSNVVAELNYNTDLKLGPIAKAAEKLPFGKEVIRRTMQQSRGTSAKLVIDITGDTAYVRSQDDIDAGAQAARDAAEAITTEPGVQPDADPDVPSTVPDATEPVTEPPTEPSTEPPAEPPAEAPTEEPSADDSGEDVVG